MSGVSKESPLAERAPSTGLPPATGKEESTSAKPAEINAVTDTVPDKGPKIFGSFTDTPKKEESSKESTPSKSLFGGFTSATSSPWSAPSTAGGFGAASAFAPKKEEAEEKEEVRTSLLGI